MTITYTEKETEEKIETLPAALEKNSFPPKRHFFFKAPIFLQSFIYLTTLVLFKIFCNFKVKGFENIANLPNGVIFAANHSSEWDGILMRVALPFFSRFSPMYYVSLEKKHYTESSWRSFFYGGFLFELLGAYPVYSGKKFYAFSLQNHLALLKQKRTLCIFPEGQRTRDGKLGEPRGGVAFLAHESKAPVIPVAITDMVGLTLKNFIFGRRNVSIIIGRPLLHDELVPNEHPSIDELKKGAGVVMNHIRELM